MKGFTHCVSGVAVASLFPAAVHSAQEGNPLYFILGAVAGLLPDTLDFKLIRYLYRYDRIVMPDAKQLDPQPVVEAVAEAVASAAAGSPFRLKLCAIRLPAETWRQYHVEIDSDVGEVRARFGPVVDSGQNVLPGGEPGPHPEAVAVLPATVRAGNGPRYAIDIFDGPGFRFERAADGAVEAVFLPWHRVWTHSFLTGALCGLLAAVAWTPLAGAVVLAAWSVHLMEDQLGQMGSCLFYPLGRRRIPGLGRMRSGDALPNLSVVWIGCAIVFWNLYAAMPQPAHHVPAIQMVLLAMTVPALGLLWRRVASRCIGTCGGAG